MQLTLRRHTHIKWNATLVAWMLLTPSLIFLVGFTVFPIIRTLIVGMMKYNLAVRPPRWIGFGNYLELFGNVSFWKVMANTLKLTVFTLLPSMVLGLFFALLCNRKAKSSGFLRTAFFYPVILPMIVIAAIFSYIYMARQGLLDTTMVFFGGRAMDALSNTKTALPSLAVLYVWRESGYLMIFFLAGLQNMEQELFEAAKLDGASRFTVLRKIILPLLAPTTLFVSTIAITNSIKQVDPILFLTNGGPNESTSTLMFHIYKNGFVYFDQGMASALTTILLLVVLSLSMIQFVKTDEKIHYN